MKIKGISSFTVMQELESGDFRQNIKPIFGEHQF